jgi:hypothetical protein
MDWVRRQWVDIDVTGACVDETPVDDMALE